MSHLLIISTCPDIETARHIAHALIDDRIAACVNIVPGVQSIYRWAGAVESAAEHILLIKTEERRYKQVQEAVLRLHPYELPEVIAVPIADGYKGYLAWITSSTESTDAPAGRSL